MRQYPGPHSVSAGMAMLANGVKKKRKKSKDSREITANIIFFKTGVLLFFTKDPYSFWANNTKKPHKQPDGWREKGAVLHKAPFGAKA